MTPDSDRRREYRLLNPATVFVELRAASPDGAEPAEVVACAGLDLSASGLQLHLDRPLPPGRILRLGANPGPGSDVLYVVGEVRWSRPEAGGHVAGVALFESEDTDIVAWKRAVAARLSD